MRLQSEMLMKILGKLGFEMTKKGAMAVIRTGTVLLNGAFVILDVYSLYQSVANGHPTIKSIKDLIENIQEECRNIVQLSNAVRDMELIRQ